MKTVTLDGMAGLEYITIINFPVEKMPSGMEVLDGPSIGHTEDIALRRIITECVPIRGKEVRFFRKKLHLSLEKLGGYLQISAAAIMKWEREPEKRLSVPNEIAVRALVAQLLNLDKRFRFDELVGSMSPKEIVIDFAKEAKRVTRPKAPTARPKQLKRKRKNSA